MSPRHIIYFLQFAIIMLVVIMIVWFIFRKRKKWAISLTSIFVLGYIAYYLYYPSLKVINHTERYEQVVEYLAKNYPNKQFDITPEHYEIGYEVGVFTVNDVESPNIGVDLRVDKEGQVTQISYWTNNEYRSQHNLWKIFEYQYGGAYTLDREMTDVSKEDEWIVGGLTTFALTIDDMPAIAIFNYSSTGYELLDLQQGERDSFISIERDGYVFIYIDESYQGEKITIHLKNGEEYSLNADEAKGRLIVEK